jgi:hypothetical protein
MGHHAMSLSLVFNKWSTVEYSYNQYCRLNSELDILKYCVIWLHFESVISFQDVCLNAVRDSLIFPPEKNLSHLADYILFNFFPLFHCIQSDSWTQLCLLSDIEFVTGVQFPTGTRVFVFGTAPELAWVQQA